MDLQKTLFIARHGKSSWDQHGVADFDRPLKERGIKNAYEIAEFMVSKELLPEIIYTSPAARALNTAIIFSRVLNFPEKDIFLRNELYLADFEEIMNVVRQTSVGSKSVMIFGHNPGVTDLANFLSDLRLTNLPTAGLVTLTFTARNWNEVQKSNLISSSCDFPGNSQ